MSKKLIFQVVSCLLFSLVGCHRFDRLIGPDKSKEFVILVAGQSNGVSMAISPSDDNYSITGMVSVLDINYGSSETVFTKDHPATTSLSWIILGDMIASKFNRPVKIVNVSVGSTSSRDWVERFLSYISQAVKDNHPDLIIWVQGEQDTAQGLSTLESYQNYRQIVSQAQGTPFYMALDGFEPGLDREPVRVAQARIISEGIALQGADIDLLRENTDNMEPSGIHFHGAGFRNHAQAWFDLIQVRFYGKF